MDVKLDVEPFFCNVMNHSAYLASVLDFEVLMSVFTWSLEVFDPKPLLISAVSRSWTPASDGAVQEGSTTGSGTPPNPSHPVSATASDAQELPAVPMRDTNKHTQPKKNHLRSLKACSEMICGAVEALCCAQTLIKCRRDGHPMTSIWFYTWLWDD